MSKRNPIRAVGRWLASGSRRLLAPSGTACAVCGGIVSTVGAELPVCHRCYGGIPWIAPQDIRCEICGRYEACADCRRRQASFVCNRSAVRYNAVMKEWLSRFKYRGDERLQLLFTGMMKGVLERLLMERQLSVKRQRVYLTYVPLSPIRLAERGFNQAELIARALGAACRIPVVSALRRVRHTDKQSYKSRQERLHDLSGAFECDPASGLTAATGQRPSSGHTPAASGLADRTIPHILIIDDVYTTGSTLHECAQTIRRAIDANIYGLTWAR